MIEHVRFAFASMLSCQWENHIFKYSIIIFLLSIQLIVGDFGLNFEQSKAQFGLWSILAAVSFKNV